MIKHTVLVLDESDVVDSKKAEQSSNITRDDLVMPAYFEFVGAEMVLMNMNGKVHVMKTKREEQFLQYTSNKAYTTI